MKHIAYIEDKINFDTYEISLTDKDIKSILRYKKLLTYNLSYSGKCETDDFINITIEYENDKKINTRGDQVIINDKGVIECYQDRNLIIQKYVLEKAIRYDYQKYKYLIYAYR